MINLLVVRIKSLTKIQLNHLNKAKEAKKGIKIDFSPVAIKHMTKTGGIVPLLASIPALIAAAAPAVEKAAALGAVGIAAGMALKKATGKGIVHKEGRKKDKHEHKNQQDVQQK